MDNRKKKPGFVMLDALWGGILLALTMLLFAQCFTASYQLTRKEQEKEEAEQAAFAHVQNIPSRKRPGWKIEENQQAVPGHAELFLRQVIFYTDGNKQLSGAAVYEKK